MRNCGERRTYAALHRSTPAVAGATHHGVFLLVPFAGAAVALVFVHVAAVVSFVKAYYALSFGPWSESHYGFVARHFWEAAPYFYSVVGVYGFAIALWWLFRPSSQPTPKRPAQTRRTPRASQRAGA